MPDSKDFPEVSPEHKAQAPLAEVMQYQSQLKSVTGGQGSFVMELSHYDPVPPHVQQQIIEQAKKEREAKRAQEEIKDSADDAVMYMSVGTVMMQKKKEVVDAKLAEKVETLELRIRSLEKQEKMLQGKFEQLQSQIKAALEGKAPQAG